MKLIYHLMVCLADVDQLEDAEVHASFRGIAFLLLLRLLPPIVHTLLWGITLFLLPQLLPSEVHTLLQDTTLPLLRLLPPMVVREQTSNDADGDDLETHLADD
ncbi:hypothetical protein Taro_027948 [Colocasia esculenta]|uniref:Uncharacterized protein n=1 Tax=Colocasia esculenta TaxID=4460 RepID=A0A843VA05_COLES|nr:hypothetical protein [Colocasia esculenta]